MTALNGRQRSAGMPNTRTVEILAQRPVRRAVRIPETQPSADPHLIPFPTRKAPTLPNRALYTIPEVMELLSLSRTTIYALIRTGRLRAVREGRSRLVSASAIAAYVALLEAEAA
jgi:excisionase family DNA binding protein